MQSTLKHARECLDSVVIAVLNIADLDLINTSAHKAAASSAAAAAATTQAVECDDIANLVCVAADNVMLGADFGIMYDKILKTIVLSQEFGSKRCVLALSLCFFLASFFSLTHFPFYFALFFVSVCLSSYWPARFSLYFCVCVFLLSFCFAQLLFASLSAHLSLSLRCFMFTLISLFSLSVLLRFLFTSII